MAKPAKTSIVPAGAVTADLRRFLTYRLATLNRRLVKQGERYFSETVGLNVAEWRVIAMLGCSGELSASDLADEANLDRGQNSRVTASLVKRGLIAARMDEADGRRNLFRLSPRGVGLFNKTIGYAVERQQRLIGVLTPDELAVFDRVLDKLLDWSTGGRNENEG